MVDAELTDLDGIGPARSDSLAEAGYPDVETLAEADHEALAEEVEISEDQAVGFVVQAENAVAEAEAEVEEAEPESVTEEIESELEEDEADEETVPETLDEAEDDSEDEPEPEPEDEVYSFTLEPETALQYDVLFAAVMRGKETMLQANRTNTQLFDDLLDQMRSADVGDTIELEADADGLNGLHNHVRKLAVEYQGNNLIDHMNAMKAVQNQVNDVRRDRLF